MKLHLTHDDKFIDAFIEKTHELEYKNHHFYIYSKSTNKNLTFVKNKNIKRISVDSLNNGSLTIEKYETVYIHYFADELIDFVIKNGDKTKFVWVFWGADAFDLPSFNKNFLAPQTSLIYKKNIAKVSPGLKGLISKWFRLYKENRGIKRKMLAARKFDYFAHYIPEDYELVSNKLKLNARFIHFTYGSLEVFAPKQLNNHLGQNILIGNSANPANNHVDAFLQLSKSKNLTAKSIYCPLSYSGTEDYKSIVLLSGAKYFNNQFKPLIDFIPKTEYTTILNSIGFAIMPHYRSQAFGNIIQLLWQGAHVFFSNKNNLFLYLKEHGLHISTIESGIQIVPLQSSKIDHNRKQLEMILGKLAVKNNYKNLLSL